MSKKAYIILLALMLSVNAFPATEWSFSLSTGGLPNFFASETYTSCYLQGSWDYVEATGFTELYVMDSYEIPTECTNAGFQGSGVITIMSLEVPGFAFFTEMIFQGENEIIQAVSPTQWGCPEFNWSGIFLFSGWNNTSVIGGATTPAIGTFTWSPTNSQVTFSNMYNVSGNSVAGSLTLDGSCAGGQLQISGSGDRGGSMYLSAHNGGVFRTNGRKTLFVVPQYRIMNATDMATAYAGFIYSGQWGVAPIRVTFNTDLGQGYPVTNVWTNQQNTSDSWSLSSITINTPFNGAFTATLERNNGTLQTAPAVCAFYMNQKSVVFCTAKDPGNLNRPMNIVLVSRGQKASPGTLDTASFGWNGSAYTGLRAMNPGVNTDTGYGMALQSDGKILIAGSINNGTDFDSGLLRLLSDGSLDTYFSGDGKVQIHSSAERSRAVAVMPSGKIILGGTYAGASAIYRLHTDGSLDNTFSSDGIAPVTGSNTHTVESVLVLGDERVMGCSSNGTSSDTGFDVWRVTAAGAMDTTFNSTGYKAETFGWESWRYCQAVTAWNNRLIAVGYGYATDANMDSVMVRYTTAGALDTSFNTTGKLRQNTHGTYEQYNSAAVQTNGRIVAAGVANVGGYKTLVARITTTGAYDTSFNTTGYNYFAVGSGDSFGEAVAIVPVSGKIVVASRARNGANIDYGVTRLNANGTVDTTFGTSGHLVTSVQSHNDEWPNGIMIQTDGKILVSGWTHNGTHQDFGLIRVWGN